MSTSTQPQFRYTQTPSKVIHLRNLPWECSEEELVEICKPFGNVVNTKSNVGANRNQAFVEFADLNQAISMVSYYASSSDPAQIRGKPVYIQYSNRHEITNNKSPGDTPSNVLLVTMEGVEANDVSIDVINLVFSAFGTVQKIATFEKAAKFQALIQFSDTHTATEARSSLDGRSIPRYLLPEHVPACHLRITYSAHADLNIKFQSHRSMDYTNPYLPMNPSALEGMIQPVIGPDGKKEFQSNVLLALIENMQYAVTVDVIDTVFSAFGSIQKIAIFEKNGQTQALVQYPDFATAAVAKEALEGHSIYEGGYCKLHLSYSHHTDLNVKAYSDKSRDYTVLNPGLVPPPQIPGVASAPPTAWQNPQAAPFYTGNAATTAVLPPLSGQVPSWGPSVPQSGPPFVSSPAAYAGHYPGYSAPAYPPGGRIPASAPTSQPSPVTPGMPPVSMAQPGFQPTMPPGGAPPPGQPHYSQ